MLLHFSVGASLPQTPFAIYILLVRFRTVSHPMYAFTFYYHYDLKPVLLLKPAVDALSIMLFLSDYRYNIVRIFDIFIGSIRRLTSRALEYSRLLPLA